MKDGSNGGFFVVNRRVIDYLDKDSEPFEKDPLEKLAKENQLFAYKHDGFAASRHYKGIRDFRKSTK